MASELAALCQEMSRCGLALEHEAVWLVDYLKATIAVAVGRGHPVDRFMTV